MYHNEKVLKASDQLDIVWFVWHFLKWSMSRHFFRSPPVDVVYVADIPVGVRGGLFLFRAATVNVIDGFFIAVAHYYDYDYEYMIMI